MSKEQSTAASLTPAQRDQNRIRTYQYSVWNSLCNLKRAIHEAKTADINIGNLADIDLEPMLAEINRVRGVK